MFGVVLNLIQDLVVQVDMLKGSPGIHLLIQMDHEVQGLQEVQMEYIAGD